MHPYTVLPTTLFKVNAIHPSQQADELLVSPTFTNNWLRCLWCCHCLSTATQFLLPCQSLSSMTFLSSPALIQCKHRCMCTSSGNSTPTCKYQSCPVQAVIALITSRGKQSAASSLWCSCFHGGLHLMLSYMQQAFLILLFSSSHRGMSLELTFFLQTKWADSDYIYEYTKECVEQLCHTKFKRSNSIKVCYSAQQFKTTDDTVPQGYTPHHSLTPAH